MRLILSLLLLLLSGVSTAKAGEPDPSGLCRLMAGSVPADLGQRPYALEPFLNEALRERVTLAEPLAEVMAPDGYGLDRARFAAWLEAQGSLETAQKTNLMAAGEYASGFYLLETDPPLLAVDSLQGTMHCQYLTLLVGDGTGGFAPQAMPGGENEGRWCLGEHLHPVALDGRPALISRGDGRAGDGGGATLVEVFPLPRPAEAPAACSLTVTFSSAYRSEGPNCAQPGCEALGEILAARIASAPDSDPTAEAAVPPMAAETLGELFGADFNPSGAFWWPVGEERYLVQTGALTIGWREFDIVAARVLRAEGDALLPFGFYRLERYDDRVTGIEVLP